ncbi:MAG: methyltransferase domain-containing protein [Proteobacteria bacterium]|nr:methyltransferase domain-containing protein [Pseudomonadota bacterium]
MKSASYEPQKHLAQSEIYPPEDKCPICGDAGPRDKRLVIQTEPEIHLLHCRRCFGLSASHMPRREVLDRIYGSYYDNSERGRVIFQNPARLARHIVSSVDLRPNSSGHVRIIDFGGGDGSISILTAERIAQPTQRPVHVQVIDYGGGAPAQRGAVAVEYLRELTDAAGDCDLVIASGVFEHIPDLGGVLTELVGKLRPGGSLYARTLYSLPLMRLFGFPMVYPAHVHDLGDKFWSAVPHWLSAPVDIVRSRPSIVETEFRQDFIRTLAAHCFKLPARIEGLWTRNPIFKFYGGWEVVLRRTV